MANILIRTFACFYKKTRHIYGSLVDRDDAIGRKIVRLGINDFCSKHIQFSLTTNSTSTIIKILNI